MASIQLPNSTGFQIVAAAEETLTPLAAPVSYIAAANSAQSYVAPVAKTYQPQAAHRVRPAHRIAPPSGATIESAVAEQIRLATAQALRSTAGQAN